MARPIILATCSGVCNVGQLTTLAAMQLVRRFPGFYRWVKIEKGKAIKFISPDDSIWVLVGCNERCACKELEKSGVVYGRTVIATDLGIVRDVNAEVRFDEISRFVDIIPLRNE